MGDLEVGAAGRLPMVGDLGRLDAGLLGQGLRQSGMDLGTLSGEESAVDRVDEQRVRQLGVARGVAPQQPSPGQSPQSVGRSVGIQAACGMQQVRSDPPLSQTEHPRDAPRATVEVADPPVEQVGELLRQFAVVRGRRQLRGVQREALGARLDALHGIGVGIGPRQQPELLGRLLQGQWLEVQGWDARRPSHPREPLGVTARHFGVGRAPREHQRDRRWSARQVAEQVQRAAVGPVAVLDEQGERARGGQRRQDVGDGGEELLQAPRVVHRGRGSGGVQLGQQKAQ